MALALLYSAVRTPFTCLLDAAKPVWVLGFPVTYLGHRQTGKRYHRAYGCGNSYTLAHPSTHLSCYGTSVVLNLEGIAIVFSPNAVSSLPEASGQTDMPGPAPDNLRGLLRDQTANRDSMHGGLSFSRSRAAASGGGRQTPDRSRCRATNVQHWATFGTTTPALLFDAIDGALLQARGPGPAHRR